MPMFQRKVRLLPFLIPLLLILAFLSITTTGTKRAPWYEQILWNLVTPSQGAFSHVKDGVKGMWHHYFALVDAQKQSDRLKKRVAALEGAMIKTVEIEEENSRLRKLLSYKKTFPYETLVARVISNDPRSEFKSVTIDRGSDDGIVPLMPVVGPRGLVGRVGKVANDTSRVLLITDPNSAVDVLVQRSRARGLLVGMAKRTALRPGYYLSRLEYLRRVSDIRDDDVVVTSGFDRVFPPGIPIGTVADLIKSKYGVFLEANVVPFENMAELQGVMVLLNRVQESLPAVEVQEDN